MCDGDNDCRDNSDEVRLTLYQTISCQVLCLTKDMLNMNHLWFVYLANSLDTHGLHSAFL